MYRMHCDQCDRLAAKETAIPMVGRFMERALPEGWVSLTLGPQDSDKWQGGDFCSNECASNWVLDRGIE